MFSCLNQQVNLPKTGIFLYLAMTGCDKSTKVILLYSHKFTAGSHKQHIFASIYITTPFRCLIDTLCTGFLQLQCKHMHFITYQQTCLSPYYTAYTHYSIIHVIMWGRCTMLTVMTSTIWRGDEQKTLATLHAHPWNVYRHNLHFSDYTLPYTLAMQMCIRRFSTKLFPLRTDTKVTMYTDSKALHPHTYMHLTHQ